ncbi:PKD domain-containing protein [bacterium]|nr:PKD domain-containing protein [bacterium]
MKPAVVYVTVTTVLLSLSLIMLSAGCGGSSSVTNAPAVSPLSTEPLPAGTQSQLPVPSELKSTAEITSGIFRAGSQFDAGLPHHNVTPVSTTAVFTPNYDPASKSKDLAYAFYSFDTTGYSHDSTLNIRWQTTHDYGDCWIGLTDWTTDTWRWYTLDESERITFPSTACIDDGLVIAAVLLVGMDTWELSSLFLSLKPPPDILNVTPSSGTEGADAEFAVICDPALGQPTSWNWDFAGAATPASSTSSHPAVTLGTPGLYHCTVTVANAAGTCVDSFYLTVCPSTFTGTIEVVDSATSIGDSTSIALEHEHDYPRIAFVNDNTDWLYLYSRDAASWRHEVVQRGADEINLGSDGLRCDADNDAHLAYYEYPQLVYMCEEAGEWQAEEIWDTEEGVGSTDVYWPDLCLYSTGAPGIAFIDAGFTIGGFQCCAFFIERRIVSWFWDCLGSENELDGLSWRCAADYDQLDQPSVIYYSIVASDLCYAKLNLETEDWDDSLIVNCAGIGPFDLAVSKADGTPHIVYATEIETGVQALTYAYFDSADWQACNPPSAGNIGDWLCIALNSAGLPVVCYYEQAKQELCYLRFTGSFWITSVIDNSADVGKYCDFALDDEDGVHFSYYDDDHNLVKYAYLP